jgi:hypothetical protein
MPCLDRDSAPPANRILWRLRLSAMFNAIATINAIATWCSYALIANVMLLNLLIAMMNNRFVFELPRSTPRFRKSPPLL